MIVSLMQWFLKCYPWTSIRIIWALVRNTPALTDLETAGRAQQFVFLQASLPPFDHAYV